MTFARLMLLQGFIIQLRHSSYTVLPLTDSKCSNKSTFCSKTLKGREILQDINFPPIKTTYILQDKYESQSVPSTPDSPGPSPRSPSPPPAPVFDRERPKQDNNALSSYLQRVYDDQVSHHNKNDTLVAQVDHSK